MKKGRDLAKYYNLDVRSAHSHDEGNWYWNLREFPGAYFDADGCVVFQTEREYLHVSIKPSAPGILRSVTRTLE